MYRTRSIVPNRLLEHRKAAADDVREEQGRPARAEHAALDFRHFQVRIDRRVDPPQLPGGFQIGDALAEVAVHGEG